MVRLLYGVRQQALVGAPGAEAGDGFGEQQRDDIVSRDQQRAFQVGGSHHIGRVEQGAAGLVDHLADSAQIARRDYLLVEPDPGESGARGQQVRGPVVAETDHLQIGHLRELLEQIAGVGAHSLPGYHARVEADPQQLVSFLTSAGPVRTGPPGIHRPQVRAGPVRVFATRRRTSSTLKGLAIT
ncbi:hypothetical protein BMS3Abin01_00339 [bacterium BMS3Abin01]|nr:hypothetical protein BMS3Abin01_00339 [bacterium BMS3Abin01]